MATRPEILNERDFEKKLEEMTPEKKIDFLAWQQYFTQIDVVEIKQNCVMCTPDRRQKTFNYTGLAGFIAALGLAFWQIIEYLKSVK